MQAELSASPSLRKVGKVRWTICGMLFFATSINYMDRQVLSILAPMLQKSIGWTDLQYSYIVGGFQFAYALGLMLAGRMVDKLGTRIGYAVIMGIWSLSAMSHALARTVFEFAAARFSLGIGESGNFPAAIKTTAEWFPQNERALATGIFNSGTSVGAILAPAIVPWVALRYGWQAAFLITGVFSASWIGLWLVFYRTPTKHRTLTPEEYAYIHSNVAEAGPSVPWKKLIGYRQTWAFALAKFVTDPIWWFYLYWLPLFLTRRFHLGLGQLSLPLIAVYNVATIGSIGGGWLPALLNRAGMTMTRARITTMLMCAIAVTPIFFVSRVSNEWTAIALISLAAAAHQGWSANLFTTASDMFPRSAVGSVVGIGGTLGSAGGVLFSLSTGWVLEITHSYASLFVISACAYLLGLGILQTLAPGLRRADVVETA
ncbi:MFS transporter [Silvibacterium acidisoli]|uniref:MFS transporter n=1 Tax=Acidobacteriaceae bacterium ZG23-2 TaxID=2883246 RepID=UPI00406CE128